MIELAEHITAEVPLASFTMECSRGGIEVIDRLAEEWTLLCSEAVEDQPFFRPEWIRAYIKRYGRGRLWLVAARRQGRLCLVLPLLEQVATFSKIPVRRLSAPVNANCSRFDGVRRKGSEGIAAIRATWNYLKQVNGWDVLQFRDALAGSTVGQIVAAADSDGFVTESELERPNPFVNLPGDPALLAQMPRNSKLRSQLRQLKDRLAGKGVVTFSRVDTADRVALNRFYELEASGWKGKTKSCVLYDGSKTFYDEIAESAARSGCFALYMLELDGRLLSAHFSLIHRGCCYSPKVAYDEEFKPFAPGHLIVAEILLDCVSRGIQLYDITGPDQPWKMKWATGSRPSAHHSVFRGRLGMLAHAVRFKIRPALKHLLGARQAIVKKPDQS